MKKNLLLTCFALLSLLGMQAQNMPVTSTNSSHSYYSIKNSRNGGYFKDMGYGSKTALSTLAAGAASQEWRIEATTPAGSYYLISKNGGRMFYNGSRYISSSVGHVFTFVTSTNTSYPNQWELQRTGGQRVNDAAPELTEYNANDAGNPVVFTLVETIVPDALLLGVEAAETVYYSSRASLNPGQYSSATCAVLLAAVNSAKVIRDNAASTQTQRDAAAVILAKAKADFLSAYNPIKISTADVTVWYALKNFARAPYNYLNANAIGSSVTSTAFMPSASLLWKVVADAGGVTGKVNIVNMKADGQITIPSSNSVAIPLTTATQIWSFGFLGNGQFNINGDNAGARQLHLDGSQVLVAYPGPVDSGSAWYFEELGLTDLIASAEAAYVANPAGSNPGQYTLENKAIFRAAIDVAVTLKANGSATSTQIDAGMLALINATDAFLASPKNIIKLSTVGNDTWYYIASAMPAPDARNGKVMTDATGLANGTVSVLAKDVNNNKCWRFVAGTATPVKVMIQNRASGLYFATTPALSATAGEYNVNSLGQAQFSFNVSGVNPLHDQAPSTVVTWGGGLGSASAWTLEEVAPPSAPSDYYRTKATGNWNALNTWESSSDNTKWISATLIPNASSKGITLLNAHAVTVTANATASALIIGAGAQLSLRSGQTLNVVNLSINNDEKSGTGTFVDENANGGLTVSGVTNVKQSLSAVRNWYVSSPVTAALKTVFNVTSPLIYSFTETSGVWAEVTADALLQIGKGYVAQCATAGSINFTGGTLNTGLVEVKGLTATAGAAYQGFHLIGNPYPSFVDYDLLSKTNLEPSLWYRACNKSKGNAYVFDTYGSLSKQGTNNSGAGAVTKNIAPMQAAWVRVSAGTEGAIAFSNAARLHQDQSIESNRLKNKAVSEQQVLRLSISNEINSDETIVLFDANAADGYDGYDSPKMSNNDAAIPEIYTVVANQNIVINGMKSLKVNQEVCLGFKADATANYTLKATEISNFGKDVQLVLIDKLLNTQKVLAPGAEYTFASDAVNNSSRFSVLFRSTSAITGLDANGTDPLSMTVLADNGTLTVQCANATKGIVKVSNALGQQLFTSVLSASRTVLPTHFNAGVYFVSLVVDGHSTTKKIIIR